MAASNGCPCGGIGCELCHGTGPLRPGYARAAAFGWADGHDCFATQSNGYPGGASAYPYPWDGGPPTQYPGTYQNFGDTCCGPYWYDFLIEGVALTRTGQASLGLTSDGIRGLGPPNLVLSSDSADFDYEPGFRVTGRYQLSAVYNIEATYLGGLAWDDRALVTSANNSLFSVYSDFGNTPFGGFLETDQASEASVSLFAELDSVEVMIRHGWISPDYRVNGSWFIGARYIRFQDQLTYRTVVSPHFDPINMVDRDAAFSEYNVRVGNDLVGPQIGTSLMGCLFPGWMLGGEAKVGAYGNGCDLNSTFNGSTFPSVFAESLRDTQFAYATEGRAYMIWQFHPMAKIRVGYEVLFLDGIATAAANFNTVAPVNGTGTRVSFLDHDDQSIFHGGNIGIELGW